MHTPFTKAKSLVLNNNTHSFRSLFSKTDVSTQIHVRTRDARPRVQILALQVRASPLQRARNTVNNGKTTDTLPQVAVHVVHVADRGRRYQCVAVDHCGCCGRIWTVSDRWSRRMGMMGIGETAICRLRG